MSTFTPSVTIDGSTPISQADDKLRTIVNEATGFINTEIADLYNAEASAIQAKNDA